jgi:hypothetical protein
MPKILGPKKKKKKKEEKQGWAKSTFPTGPIQSNLYKPH